MVILLHRHGIQISGRGDILTQFATTDTSLRIPPHCVRQNKALSITSERRTLTVDYKKETLNTS
uniref:Uncharacterized protein n=1 Tax=Arion vulgaris TaxID=1028688 RepID=A0A0B6Z1A7_9EUPU